MKPTELSRSELELITPMLEQRRRYYLETADDFVASNKRYFKKKTQDLDRVLGSMIVGENYFGPSTKGLLQGCMNEFLMKDVRDELRRTSGFTQPALYRYYQAHPDKIAREELVLGLWNKLVKKEERYRLPSKFLALLDEVFSAERVYASFSELKPYKVAFFIGSGKVYLLSLDSEREEIQGPYKYTREELSDLYMKCLTPNLFCEALSRYGRETTLHGWHTLLVDELKSMAVVA